MIKYNYLALVFSFLLFSIFSFSVLANDPEGLTRSKAAGICYAEQGGLRGLGGGFGSFPAAEDRPDPFFGTPAYDTPGGNGAGYLVRRRIVRAMLCRLHLNKTGGGGFGMAPPSPEYDPESSNPIINEYSTKCERATDDEFNEWNGLSTSEKDSICTTTTHFWHECYTAEIIPTPLPELNPITYPVEPWIENLRDDPDGLFCGYPGVYYDDPMGYGQIRNPVYFWNPEKSCFAKLCVNEVPVRL